jgi:hypothetical protein
LIAYDKGMTLACGAVMNLRAIGDCSAGKTPMRRSFEIH